MNKFSLLLCTIFFAGAFFNQSLYACSVCGFADDGTREAYLLTGMVLTSIPLMLIGGTAYLIFRYTAKKNAEIDSQSID